MLKTADFWGECRFRELKWAKVKDSDGAPRGKFFYICKKTGSACTPDYCLGPDEDENSEKEGDREDI